MLRALIVEDKKDEANLLGVYLENASEASFLRFDRVDVAYSCEEAIKFAEAGIAYDLIIYDLELPWKEGESPSLENGLRLVQELGPLARSACGILYSAFTRHEYALEMYKIGSVSRLVPKPAAPRKVLLVAEEAILEAAQATAEKLSASYHLQARVHESMNSLNNILAAVSEIERICSPTGDFVPSRSLPLIREEVENIRRFQRAAEDSLRDLNPTGTAKREPCDMSQIAEWCVSYLGSQHRKQERRIELHIEGYVPTTLGVREELQQLVLVLVRNALQATEESGHVAVSVRYDPHESHEIMLAVEDNGKGIPPAIQDQIFERGFTTEPGSRWGQGLFLARAFAWHHGGRIQIESPETGGTRVTVRLPLREVIAGE